MSSYPSMQDIQEKLAMQEIRAVTQDLLVLKMPSMDDIHTRIRALRTTRGLSMQQLAAEVDVSWQTVQQWEKGSTAPKRLRLEKVAVALGSSVDFLLHGTQTSLHTATLDFDANVHPASIGMRRIPLINDVQAVQLTSVDADFSGEVAEYLLTDLPLSARAFAFEIRGNSMQPMFQPGDRVVIDRSVAPLAGDFVIARNGSAEITFRKYRARGLTDTGVEIFELAPLNDDYPTLHSDKQQLALIGTMMEHRRYRRL